MSDVSYLAFEEVYEKRIEKLDIAGDFESNELQGGDIIIFQKDLRKAPDDAHPTVKQFFEKYWIANKVHFKSIIKPHEEGFTLSMTTKTSLLEIQQAIVDHLKLPKDSVARIQVTNHNFRSRKLSDIIDQKNKDAHNLAYYQLLNTVPTAEDQVEMTVLFRDEKSQTNKSQATFYFPERTSDASTILLTVKTTLLDCNKPNVKNYRMLAICDHRIRACFSSTAPDQPIQKFRRFKERAYQWIVEEIPEDQMGSPLVEVVFWKEHQFSRYSAPTVEYCSFPIYINFKGDDEKISSLRARLQTLLNTKSGLKIYQIYTSSMGGSKMSEYKKSDDSVTLKTTDAILAIKKDSLSSDRYALRIENAS